MRLLSRTLFREAAPLFGLSLAALTGVFLLHRMFHWLDLVLNKGVPFPQAVKLYASLIPVFLSMTTPMAVLLTVLGVSARWSADGEVTALKAGGIHPGRLCFPFVFFAFFLGIGMIAFNHFLLPRSNYAFKQTYFDILQQRASVLIQDQVLIDAFEGYTFSVDRRGKDGLLQGVRVFSKPRPDTPLWITLAKHGRLLGDAVRLNVSLVLEDGVILWSAPQDFQTYHRMYFKKHTIPLSLGQGLPQAQTPGKEPPDMDLMELREDAAKWKHRNPSTSLRMQTEFHKRLALPMACPVVAWLAAPLGFWLRRRSGAAFSVGIFTIFLYYIVFIWTETAGQKGFLPAAGIWTADLLFGILGFFFFRLAADERLFPRSFFPRRKGNACAP